MRELPIRLRCPRCSHIERMTVFAPLKMWQKDYSGKVRPCASTTSADFAAGAAVCPSCRTPFGLTFTKTGSANIEGLLSVSGPDAADASFSLSSITTYPSGPQQFIADKHIPDKIRKAFVYLQEDAAKKRNAAGLMSGARTCLDVALKELGETEGSRRSRINNLAARGIITSSIDSWAQDLWSEGSDAVHDLEADIDRALEHVEFLKLFFEVAFALPARIAAAAHEPADGAETELTPS